MRHVLALDQGTTSSRAIIFDETGTPVASASQEFKQHYPQPGWVEHDPDDLWRSQRDVAREALRNSGLKAENLVACGITNQRETTIVWDRQNGKPIYPAIVWQDRRTAARCAELKEVGARIVELLEILSSRPRRMEVMTEELLATRATLNQPRLTRIVDYAADIDDESLIAPASMIVTLTRDGYVKRTPLDVFRSQHRGGRGRSAASTRADDVVVLPVHGREARTEVVSLLSG
jgi:hypothetical protein